MDDVRPPAASAAPEASSVGKPPKVKLVRATVARGRSIDIPTDQLQTIAFTDDKQPITRVLCKSYGPGQEVQLPEHEVIELRARGYLIDPDKIAPPLAIGPSYGAPGT